MSHHTAKRPRLTGSFSPASPPYHELSQDQTKTVVQPNTPTSPPYSSMNSQSNGGPAMNATAPAPEMTPPSSVYMSQQVSQSAVSASNPHPFPTPGSTTGIATSSNIDSDVDAMVMDDDAERLSEHRHSNHNRQRRGELSGNGALPRDTGAYGSSLFKLCQSTHPLSRPHGSQNLFDLYGLSDLARSVARTDPATGEKINKLRKSYEGHIKALQIAGKPKAVKMDGVISQIHDWPEEEWYNQKVYGKGYEKAVDLEKGGLTADFDSLLNSAFTGMAPGPLPSGDSNRYRAYLGTDEVSKSKVGVEGQASRGIHPTSATPTPINPAAGSRASRPERSGSKRSYTDASFPGYSEGFADDGYADSPGEDDGQGGIAKKRRLGGFERTSHSVEVGGARR